MLIETVYFIVDQIDGDYAYLKKEDGEPGEEPRCVARALLPLEIMEGTRIRYEMLQYEICD